VGSVSGRTAPAIKVADNIIIDGNYRYIAGRIMGTEPGRIPPCNVSVRLSTPHAYLVNRIRSWYLTVSSSVAGVPVFC
jgi:hypothetical protein